MGLRSLSYFMTPMDRRPQIPRAVQSNKACFQFSNMSMRHAVTIAWLITTTISWHESRRQAQEPPSLPSPNQNRWRDRVLPAYHGWLRIFTYRGLLPSTRLTTSLSDRTMSMPLMSSSSSRRSSKPHIPGRLTSRAFSPAALAPW